ncbi:hypothetical protein I79_010501 [Cricetulus griseus]|uniref:Uncharacterized protein n=1 Tax=Cricetulus griseus TaxID=10029 RepID=G3HIM7_CRIGR|nr:hypothetical protein I79_010501 [Cricetulus griseus]
MGFLAQHRLKGHLPCFLYLGLTLGGALSSLVLNQVCQRSSGPSWAAVGTLGQLSFHPHQRQPAQDYPCI